jgi:arginine deiminase
VTLVSFLFFLRSSWFCFSSPQTEKEKNPVPWRQEIWHFLHKFDENQNDDDAKSVAKTEENEDKRDNEKDNESKCWGFFLNPISYMLATKNDFVFVSTCINLIV